MDNIPKNIISNISKEIRICDDGPWMLPEATKFPTGSEHGKVLVIGIGGSTLRLCCVKISSNESESSELISRSIPEYMKPSDQFFQWCADQIIPVLNNWSEQHGKPLLAVSWSFPLLRGRVLSMGKSFGTTHNGKDILSLFNDVLPSKYIVNSVTHDGTSSLVAGIHHSPACKMALTLGTGVNINLRSDNGTLVNTEISMLGREDTTPHIKLAQETFDVKGPHADFQPFEAQVGGMYLEQMVSNALQSTVTNREIWQILEQKDDSRYNTVNKIINRSALLVAAVIHGLYLTNNTSEKKPDSVVEVAYTGGVIFEKEFRSRLETHLDALELETSVKIMLVPQRFGSEIGTAIAALTVQA